MTTGHGPKRRQNGAADPKLTQQRLFYRLKTDPRAQLLLPRFQVGRHVPLDAGSAINPPWIKFQSAGRVIRSETDKGIIILMDDRFLEKSYGASLPQDWFLESPRELVSSSILNDVKSFWDKTKS